MSDEGGILLICSERMNADDKRRWSILIPALRSRASEVIVVTMFSADALCDELAAAGISARCIRVSARTGHIRPLTSTVKEAALVLTQGLSAQVIGGLIAARYDVPHVVNGHTAAAPKRPRINERMLMRLTGPRVDGIIATDRDQLPRLVEYGYLPTRIRVIRDGDCMVDQYQQAFAEIVADHAIRKAEAAAVEPELPTKTLLPRRLVRHLNSALSRGVGYEFTPPGVFVDESSVRGYYIDFRAKTISPSSRRPEQLLPAGLAQLALGWWERILAGEAHATDEFRRTCALLEQRADRRDGQLLWAYDGTVRKYPLAWPPYSGLAQAQAASVFVRAYTLSGDARDADLAQRAIRSLTDLDSDLVATTSAGPILEESPGEPTSHILNGWIYALWGLRDVELALGSAEAASMYEASLSCLRGMLDCYDVGWWTKYSLYPHKLPDLAKPFYHRLHADQAEILYRLTGHTEFGDAARRWRSYDTSVNWARAIAQKSLFVSTGYA